MTPGIASRANRRQSTFLWRIWLAPDTPVVKVSTVCTPAEAAAGGTIGLVQDGDEIVLDVDARRIELLVDDDVLAERRAKMEASERPWQPAVERNRHLTSALRAYAKLVTSGATGAVRSV